MRELLRMIIVLAVICGCSGLVLSFTNQVTLEQRENQLLTYVQGPSIQSVLSGQEYDNDPIQDRFTVSLGEDDQGNPIEMTVFPAKKGDDMVAMAYASSGMGYGGEIDVMVGFDREGNLAGVSIMTHAETPGLGARIEEPGFTEQFRNLEVKDGVQLSQDGGEVDGISGASFSSKGVVSAINKAVDVFPKVKEEVS
ncbi:MAG: RnfABCDGE type electron transport complex subunit G [Deltaproteobacteria bacterium]|nr:RnfABCDGE type electron transport complex subunit G [Deltaproteobacteria bacterium]